MDIIAPVKLTNINNIISVLGATTPTLFPFWESKGTIVTGISAKILESSDEAAVKALEDEFAPILHRGGIYTYHFNTGGNNHLKGSDDASYSFGNGTVDTPLSLGALILPNVVNENAITAKYDSAGNKEEYKFGIDANGKLELELHDAGASASEIAVSTTALLIGKAVFVVAAYDGSQAAPVINLYVDAKLDNDGTTVESGTYVAMENTTAPLLIGSSGVTAAPLNEFSGRLGMPFLCPKFLSQSDVTVLHHLYEEMFGLES